MIGLHSFWGMFASDNAPNIIFRMNACMNGASIINLNKIRSLILR